LSSLFAGVLSRFFARVWADGFPVEYRVEGQRLSLGFRGSWRSYYLVLRRGLEGEDLYSMTLTGTDFYDFAVSGPGGLRLQAHLLPKYMGEVGGQLGVHEALVWSERMLDFEEGGLEEVRHPPEPLRRVYRERVAGVASAEPVYMRRPYLPEYVLCLRVGGVLVAAAWYNAIGGRVEGLVEAPHLLKSCLAALHLLPRGRGASAGASGSS